MRLSRERSSAYRTIRLAACTTVLLTAGLNAATVRWDGGTDTGSTGVGTSWATLNNWVGDLAPATTGDDLLFNAARSAPGTAASSFTNTVAATLSVSRTFSVNSITFDGSLGKLPAALSLNTNGSGGTTAQTLTLSGAADGSTALITMSGYTTAASVTFNAATAGTLSLALGTSGIINVAESTSSLVLNPAISGTGFGLTKTGSGNLTLSGANTFTGALTINGGQITLGGGSNTFSGVTVNSGGTLSLSSATYLPTTNVTTLNSGSTLALTGSVSLSSTARTYLLNSGTETISVSGSNSFLIGGSVSGSGTLVKTGTGTLRLSTLTGATNTYSGGLTISDGTVQVSTASNLGDSSNLTTIGAATLLLYNNAFYSSNTQTLQTTRNFSLINASSTISVGGAEVWTIGGGISGSGTLNKAGSGTLILTGTGSYTGSTVISAGVLQIGSGGTTGVLASGTVSNAGTLAINHSDVVNVTNPISGSGAVTQAGAGTTVLSGSNAYTGGTAINAGVMEFLNSNSLPTGGTIAVATGAGVAFGVGGATQFTAAGLDTARAATTFAGNGTLGLDTTAAATAFTYSSAIADPSVGTLGLVKSGSGTLTLAGANLYTGSTTVTAGVLAFASPTAVNGSLNTSNIAISNGATLRYTGTGTSTLAKPIAIAAGSETIDVPESSGVLTESGAITGSGTLIKTGAGQLNVSNTNNTFSGGVTIKTGTLRISATGGLGNSGASVVDEIDGGATLSFNLGVSYSGTRSFLLVGPGTSTISVDSGSTTTLSTAAVINGTGNLTKAGSGTLTLNSGSDYSGGTTISAGNVRANYATASATVSSTGTGPVTVANNGVLGGNGFVNGLVTVQSGGTITAGTTVAAVGQLKTVGGQVWQSGGTYNAKFSDTVTATTGYDNLVMSTLDLSALSSASTSTKFNITLSRITSGTFVLPADAAYTLATTGAITLPAGFTPPEPGSSIDLTSLFVLNTTGVGVADSSPYSITLFGQTDGDGGFDLNFAVAATPEPTTAALFGLGGSVLLGRRRRQRGRNAWQAMLKVCCGR